MEKLPEVATARALMTEAMAWSVMKWLREKKRVRKTADQANAALDQLSARTRQRWPDPIRNAYELLVASAAGTATAQELQKPRPVIAADATLMAKSMKESDDEALRARMDAEAAFDLAEKQLSTASRVKDVKRRSIRGTCTKKRFAKRKLSFARSNEAGQKTRVDGHSDHGIYADSIQIVDFLL
jgi:hypothetical protein